MVDDNVIPGRQHRTESLCSYIRFHRNGSGCTIFDHSVIGGEPQDITFRNEESVRIGNNLMCREYVTINRAVGEG